VLKFAYLAVSNFTFFKGDYNTKRQNLDEFVLQDCEFFSKRLDVFLATKFKISRNQIANLINDGRVTINDKTILKPSMKLNLNDKISVEFVSQKANENCAEVDFDVPIIYEDEDLLVLNKPANLVVHPAPSVKEPTLVDWLGAKGFLLSNLSGQSRAGIVHRLDKGTSGAIVVAKNNAAHAALSSQLSDKSMGRIYLALTDLPLKQNCIVERAIGRNPANRLKKAIVSDGRAAKSAFANLLFSEFDGSAQSKNAGVNLIAAKLFTGRTHQIRVHLTSLNRHILGDALYGFKSEKDKIGRVMLHAYGLYFAHPRTGGQMSFIAPVWDDFSEIAEKNFNKELIYEKIDFKRLDTLFSACDDWLRLS